MKDIFSTPPDFTNEMGTKWWKDESTTQYARRKDRNDISLDADCFFVETKDGVKTRILIDKDTFLEEDQTLDGMGSKIDVRKALIHMEKKS